MLAWLRTLFGRGVAPGALDRFDINGDGQVSPLDALCVQRDNAGLPGTSGCPQPLVHNRVIATGVPPAALSDCILKQCAGLPRDPICIGG